MSVSQVALLGPPNTGKTTLFNALTGQSARVGNYPGITIDRRSGTLLKVNKNIELVDVPGAYSLSARSPEEALTLGVILGTLDADTPPPDLALLVVDATRPQGSLYLAVQVLELGVPAVVALTLADELAGPGPDVAALSKQLGVPVVAVSARTGLGLDALRHAVQHTLESGGPSVPAIAWPQSVGDAVSAVAPALPGAWLTSDDGSERRAALARHALLSIDEDDELEGVPEELRQAVYSARAANPTLDEELIGARYRWLDEGAAEWAAPPPPRTRTERLDALLLHPVGGFAVFVVLMGTLFQALFVGADPLIGAIEAGVGGVDSVARAVLPAGIVADFVGEALVGGVGNVVVFVPQIALLFLMIGFLEASGYMARAAYLMDRLMRACGLHGRAFVPMLSGFACAVPAIMATRTMERRRDRLLTMMVVPLMTCSARLPVYTLIIAALFPPDTIFGLPVQGLLMMGMYLFSVVVALLAAAVLGRTVLRGPQVPLLLELPPYRLPRLSDLLRHVWLRTRQFLYDAGTVILGFTVAMWLLLSFPAHPEPVGGLDGLPEAEVAAWQAEALEHSAAGRFGKAIEPAIRPLGFDWKIGVGLVGAFAAREVFVSTMGLVYGIGEDVDEETPALRDRIRAETHADGAPVYTPLSGLSLLVFFALAAQCMSTLAVVKRETGGYAWPAFLFAYMTALAWVCSFAVYQGGRLLGFG